jgi:hypothetical protein
VVKLPMAAFHSNLKPPVSFDPGNAIADLRSAQFTPRILKLRNKTWLPSLRFDVRLLDHRAPFDDFLVDECRVFLGAVARRLARLRQDALLDLRAGDDARDVGVNLRDDCLRRAPRRRCPNALSFFSGFFLLPGSDSI